MYSIFKKNIYETVKFKIIINGLQNLTQTACIFIQHCSLPDFFLYNLRKDSFVKRGSITQNDLARTSQLRSLKLKQ